MAVGATPARTFSQSVPQSIIMRARPRLTRSALWRRWRRDRALISPRVPRKTSSIVRAPCASRSRLADRDLLLFLLRLGRLRQGHREHAILEACRDLVGIDALRHLERALEGPEATLREVIVLLLFFLLLALLAPDGEEAVGELHLDILLVEARQLGRDLVFLVLLDDIDGRRLAEGKLTAPERLDIEHAASERTAAPAEAEILEQVVDLASEIGKRGPLAASPARLGLCLAWEFGSWLSHCDASFTDWSGMPLRQRKFAYASLTGVKFAARAFNVRKCSEGHVSLRGRDDAGCQGQGTA